ncbi:hypothetical protein IX329_000718 [Fusobacterium necrophorum]|nr:hypothetical protein [Fusobacterium necrophorum]MBR8789311.1 hypothetical protein [Fusobacterium necrophorum]
MIMELFIRILRYIATYGLFISLVFLFLNILVHLFVKESIFSILLCWILSFAIVLKYITVYF